MSNLHSQGETGSEELINKESQLPRLLVSTVRGTAVGIGVGVLCAGLTITTGTSPSWYFRFS